MKIIVNTIPTRRTIYNADLYCRIMHTRNSIVLTNIETINPFRSAQARTLTEDWILFASEENSRKAYAAIADAMRGGCTAVSIEERFVEQPGELNDEIILETETY